MCFEKIKNKKQIKQLIKTPLMTLYGGDLITL